MYKDIFNISTDGMLIIEDGMFVDCNDSVVKMLQYENKEQLLNTHPSELSPEFQPDGRSSYDKVEDNTKYVLEHGSRTFEWIHLRANGEPFWVEVVLTDMSTDDKLIFLTVWREIGEKKQLEEENSYQHMLLTSVLDSNIDLIFYKDYSNEDGKYIGCNHAFEVFVGKSKEEIIGHNDIELFGKELGEFFREKDLDVIKKKTNISNEEWVKYPNGEDILLQTKKSLLSDNKENIIGILGISRDITKQKNLENKLRASKRQFELFMKNIPANILIKNEKRRIIYANHSASAFFDKENIVGLDAYDLLPKAVADVVTAFDERATKEGISEEVMEFIDHTGQTRIYHDITFAIRQKEGASHTGTILFDITKQYKDQHEIAKLKQILEKSPVSIVITDVSGNIEYVNPWFTELTGYSSEEAIGKNPKILKSDYYSDSDYVDLWDKITHGHVWSGTFKNIKKNGEEYWESAIIAPVKNEQGEIVNYIGIKQEVTEQMHLRRELADKEEIMIAQSRHAAMGEMIGMIAHQWRQPITVIAMGANNLLVDIDLHEVNEESIKEESESILKQTEYLSKTIDDFRNFFRSNKEMDEVSLDEVMAEAEKIIGKTLEHSNVALSIKHENGYKVKTYSRELLQVYINLLKNAKEALIENREKDRHINVVISDDADHIITTICDNGGGIDKAIIEKIFDPYFSTKDEKTGTGLGLYMSKTIIEKHLHGTIEAYNTEDGACFKVAIPLECEGGGSRK